MVGSPDPTNEPLPAPAQTPQPNQPAQAGTNGGVVQPQDAPAPLYDTLRNSVDHVNQAIHNIDHALHSIKASGMASTREAEHAVVGPIESVLREAKTKLESAVQSARSHL